MTDPQPRPPRRIPTANALYDALVCMANELDMIRGVCERAHLVTLDPTLSVQERWKAAEFPIAIGSVMGIAYLHLDRLEQAFGITPERNEEQRARRARVLLSEFRLELHKEFGGGGDVDALRKALAFCRNIADEELAHVKVGTGAEVALRHIARKAREAIGDE